MPLFKDSYQTTIGSVFVTKQIELAIKQAIIKDGLNEISLGVEHKGDIWPVFITGTFASESEIPLFTHPITIFNYQHKSYLCTDLRLYLRKDVQLNQIEDGIRNRTEYDQAKSRAILSMLWVSGNETQIKNGLQFAGTVFAAWLSETIAKTYALDFKDQTTLAIITSFYYQSLFSDKSVFDEDDKQRMAAHTMRATNVPADFVFKVFDRITAIEGIDDYCTNVVNILENVRLKGFNLAMLLTIVKNSWYGTNAKEIVSIALEHPPTWCSIIHAALSERTYKSSNIYKIAERFGKRGNADEFLKNYGSLIRDCTNIAKEEQAVVIHDF